VLLGKGDGTFEPQVTYLTGAAPDSVAAADLNGDGQLDLAVANYADSTASELVNQGDGTFQPRVTYPTGLGSSSIAAADLNGDGQPDLAVANDADSTVSVLLNTCSP
jgi:hypothetical protein